MKPEELLARDICRHCGGEGPFVMRAGWLTCLGCAQIADAEDEDYERYRAIEEARALLQGTFTQ